MSTQPFDHGIPLLTEVLSEQAEVKQIAQAQPASLAHLPEPESEAESESQTAPSQLVNEPDWEAIEARLTRRILHQVQGKIDHLLEERIAHVLQTALQNALIGMRGALREDLQQSLEQIVAHAVSHELGHLHRPQQ